MENHRKTRAVDRNTFVLLLERVAGMLRRPPEASSELVAALFLRNLEDLRTMTRRALQFGVVANVGEPPGEAGLCLAESSAAPRVPCLRVRGHEHWHVGLDGDLPVIWSEP